MIEKLSMFLESEGGKVAVILFLLTLLLALTMVLHMTHRDPARFLSPISKSSPSASHDDANGDNVQEGDKKWRVSGRARPRSR